MAIAEDKRVKAEDEAHQLRQKLIQVEKEHEKTQALLDQERQFAAQRTQETQSREQVGFPHAILTKSQCNANPPAGKVYSKTGPVLALTCIAA